jgi:hypothetical protein
MIPEQLAQVTLQAVEILAYLVANELVTMDIK